MSAPIGPKRGEPALVVNAAELLREPGVRRQLTATVPPADVGVCRPAITGDLAVDVTLESTLDDVVVAGFVDVAWHGVCRRCVSDFDLTLHVDLEDRYADQPTRDRAVTEEPGADVGMIVRGQLDLRDLVRDEVLLAVDAERLCRDDCAGLCPTCGSDLNERSCDCAPPVTEGRWSALDQLRTSD